MFWAVRGLVAIPLAGTYEMPVGGIDTWYAAHGQAWYSGINP